MLKSTWLDLKSRYLLSRMGHRQLRHRRCDNGAGGSFMIDRLVLHSQGASVIMVLRYPGHIFCADHIDEWTQLIDGRSFIFSNPLIELDLQVAALAEQTPDIPMGGYLYFDHRASFPKGKPERVIQLDSMPDVLFDRRQKLQPAVIANWERLLHSL